MKYPRLFSILLAFVIVSGQISACALLNPNSTVNNLSDYPRAEIVFQVALPDPLPEDSKMILEVLDDVTGLYFNSSRFEMAKKDDLNFFIRLPLAISSEVKYRYIRAGASTDYEYNSQNQQVRYRILRVDEPEIVQDFVATWMGQVFSGPQGRILGQAIDKSNNAPIPNLLVSAGGLQTVTASDGSFILEGLKPGVHNLVIYSMDGAYETFQQGALIADGGTTPVIVFLDKRPTADVTFTVKIPSDIDKTLPLRFVSNLQDIGNAYADLSSGSSGSAANYPAMQKVATDTYSIKLKLPVGAYFRYKYSLGDGFWNSELDGSGKFAVRELIVEKDQTRTENVQAFSVEGSAPITFNLQTPLNTPANEQVYIQLNPFGWMEPIPMVSSGENNWHYTIYNPTHLLGSIEYRFCRNGQCEIAGGISSTETVSIKASSTPQNISTVITSWSSLDTAASQPSIATEGGPAQPRPDWLSGVELAPGFPANWKSSIDQGLSTAYSLGGDFVILTPTWSASQGALPLLQPTPGRDLLWNDLQNMVNHVSLNKQKTILFPLINYTQSSDNFWGQANQTAAWWNSWYEKYQRFVVNNADLANIMDVPSMIIGDPSSIPSMGGGTLTDGNPSGAPTDADTRWRQLITDVRARYSGTVIGVAIIDSNREFVPAWLDSVDAVYVLISPSLEVTDNSSVTEIRAQVDKILNEKVKPISEKYQKPVILGISYPSSAQAFEGYFNTNPYRITSPKEAIGIGTNMQVQTSVYNAIILSASSTDWIGGFFSRGYYPYVSMQDASSSIYKKPAADVLWFWYHFLLNKAP